MSDDRYKDVELGFLQMQVLWMLQQPTHGYDLIKKLNRIKKTKVTAGTLYPLLKKLEGMQLVKSRTEQRRKVYNLTKNGRAVMTRSCLEFCQIFEGIFKSFVCTACEDHEYVSTKLGHDLSRD